MPDTPSEALSERFVSCSIETVGSRTVEVVKTLLGDYLGVALGGSRTDSARIAARFVAETGGREEATVIGHGGRVPASEAAFANAIASHSIELDDIDVLALFHFSPPVVSAALATAERVGASGADLLTAVAAGCEMMERASRAANISLRNRGFHTTPACGVFGAAVAAGVLLKLDRGQMTSALGLAGAQASGLMEMYGPSMQKRFNPGPAARNGVTAAALAELGFTGAASVFDGERGFCAAFSDEADLDALTRDLDRPYELAVEYKPYSCARPIHNAIDCALEIRRALTEPLSAVRRIEIRRHPDWAPFHLNPAPRTYHEAQVSLPYSVAVALIEGAALPAQYRDDKLGDPDIRRLSGLVEVAPDDSLPRGVSCRMTLETAGGAVHAAQVDHPRGSIQNPMTREEMDRKVHHLADEVIGADAVGRLLATIGEAENLESMAPIMSLAGAPGGA